MKVVFVTPHAMPQGGYRGCMLPRPHEGAASLGRLIAFSSPGMLTVPWRRKKKA